MDSDNDLYSESKYPYTNKNFSVTLPTPAANLLGGLGWGSPSSLTTTPGDMKFSSAFMDFTGDYLELTNIEWQNVNDQYKVKKGEGFIRFIYASKAGVVNGTVVEVASKQTFLFANCQFRQGWNEMVLLAAADAASDGSVTINVTTNNAPNTFKWVTQADKTDPDTDPEEPVINDKVAKINGEAIEYAQDYIFRTIGDKTYVNKAYSEREWSYLSDAKTGNYDGWSCHFTYGIDKKVNYTEYYPYRTSTEAIKTQYIWTDDKIISVYDYGFLEGYGMSLDIEYGSTKYTLGNIDINWLIMNSPNLGNNTFKTPWESAIGIKSTLHDKLIEKIVLKDLNSDKYSSTSTFSYEFNKYGYITEIKEHRTYKLGYEPLDVTIYKFEYQK